VRSPQPLELIRDSGQRRGIDEDIVAVAIAPFDRLRNRDLAITTPRERVVAHAPFDRLRNRDLAITTPRERVVAHARSSAVFTSAWVRIAFRMRSTASPRGTPLVCDPSRNRNETVPPSRSCSPAIT